MQHYDTIVWYKQLGIWQAGKKTRVEKGYALVIPDGFSKLYGFLFGVSDPRRVQIPGGTPVEEVTEKMAVLNLPKERLKRYWQYQHKSDFPTWGQVKALAGKAEGMLTNTGVLKTAKHLLLAMVAVSCLLVQCGKWWHVYSSYIPIHLCYDWQIGPTLDLWCTLMITYICLVHGILLDLPSLQKRAGLLT